MLTLNPEFFLKKFTKNKHNLYLILKFRYKCQLSCFFFLSGHWIQEDSKN